MNDGNGRGAHLRIETRARIADRIRHDFFSSRLAYARALAPRRAGTLLRHLPRRAPATGRACSRYSSSRTCAYRVVAVIRRIAAPARRAGRTQQVSRTSFPDSLNSLSWFCGRPTSLAERAVLLFLLADLLERIQEGRYLAIHTFFKSDRAVACEQSDIFTIHQQRYRHRHRDRSFGSRNF